MVLKRLLVSGRWQFIGRLRPEDVSLNHIRIPTPFAVGSQLRRTAFAMSPVGRKLRVQ